MNDLVLASRMEGVRISDTSRTRERVAELIRSGRSILGMAAGEADFPTPEPVLAAAERAVRDPRLHRYGPGAGYPWMREAVADYRNEVFGVNDDPASVVVTNGAKQAAFNAILAVVDRADEVLVPTPCWGTYPAMVKIAGGRPVPVPTRPEAGYVPTVAQFEMARSQRSRAVVLLSPGNPTGVVWPPGLVRDVVRWAREHNMWVISDEIYGELVALTREPASVAALVPDALDRVIVVHGVSKAFAMTGWRVGWLVAPSPVVSAVTALQSHSTSHAGGIAQYAATAALTQARPHVQRMRAELHRRRDKLCRALSHTTPWSMPQPEGAFYLFPQTKGALTHEDLATELLVEHGIATVSGTSFGASSRAVRISCGVSEEVLDEAADRLRRAYQHPESSTSRGQ